MRRIEARGLAVAWGAGALALALLFVLARLFAPGLLLAAAAPALRAGNALSAASGALFAGFADAHALAAANRALTEENAALALENRSLAEKLADVTKLIGTTTPAAPGVVAGVLARPPAAPYGTLILAGGTSAGIMRAMEAFGPGGVPLGVVSSATDSFSRVTLFSAPGVASQAWVGTSRVPLVLHGAGAGAFTAAVPQGAGVAVGDAVYLPGPGARAVGRVARLTGATSDPVVTLAISPVENPFSVTWVSLVDTGYIFTLAASSSPATTTPAL